MKYFRRSRSAYALILTLGSAVASCVTPDRNPTTVSSDSRHFTATAPAAATKAAVQTSSGQLPLSFEANHGQSDAHVRFLSHSRGYTVSLASTEALITLPPQERTGEAEKRRSGAARTGAGRQQRSATHNPQSTMLRLQLAGANPRTTVSGVDELPGLVNYISGQDQTQWHTSIPTYTKVKYENVYPGIDLIYYGNDQRQLEYDFQVAPAADPTAIRLKFVGVDTLDVNSAGELVLHTTGGDIRQHRPQIYQEVTGVRQHCRWRLRHNRIT